MTGIADRRRSDTLDPAIRCFLFYGSDEAGARALATETQARLGADAERVDLSPAQLKADPALLADEAASRSLFGSRRYIRVDGAGDESVAAVETLLRSPTTGDPAILVAGALRKDSRLVKLLQGESSATVRVCHPPSATDLARIVADLGRSLGLRIDRELAGRIAEACGGDRLVIAGEVAKLADFADVSPDSPRAATSAMFDAVGADSGEADTNIMLDALFSGDVTGLERALARAASGGGLDIPVARAVQRRLLAMAAARADMDRGATPREAVDRLGRALFWREKDGVARDLPKWSARRLTIAVDRVAALERTLKSSRGPGSTAAGQLYLALARSVRR